MTKFILNGQEFCWVLHFGFYRWLGLWKTQIVRVWETGFLPYLLNFISCLASVSVKFEFSGKNCLNVILPETRNWALGVYLRSEGNAGRGWEVETGEGNQPIKDGLSCQLPLWVTEFKAAGKLGELSPMELVFTHQLLSDIIWALLSGSLRVNRHDPKSSGARTEGFQVHGIAE